eukprot:11351932-Heterocapsa_arctica.AAC.1
MPTDLVLGLWSLGIAAAGMMQLRGSHHSKRSGFSSASAKPAGGPLEKEALLRTAFWYCLLYTSPSPRDA